MVLWVEITNHHCCPWNGNSPPTQQLVVATLQPDIYISSSTWSIDLLVYFLPFWTGHFPMISYKTKLFWDFLLAWHNPKSFIYKLDETYLIKSSLSLLLTNPFWKHTSEWQFFHHFGWEEITYSWIPKRMSFFFNNRKDYLIEDSSKFNIIKHFILINSAVYQLLLNPFIVHYELYIEEYAKPENGQ